MCLKIKEIVQFCLESLFACLDWGKHQTTSRLALAFLYAIL